MSLRRNSAIQLRRPAAALVASTLIAGSVVIQSPSAAAFSIITCNDAAAGVTVNATSGSTDSLNISIAPTGSGPYSGGCKIAVVVTTGSNAWETSWGSGAAVSGTPTESVSGTTTNMSPENISDGTNTVSAYVWDSGSGLFDYSTGTTASQIRLWVVTTSASDWTSAVVGTVTTSLTSGSAPSPGSSGSSSGQSALPAPWLQQYAVEANAACESVPAGLDLGPTGVTGGWTKSWANWAAKISGGWVCSRTLTYDPQSRRWAS